MIVRNAVLAALLLMLLGVVIGAIVNALPNNYEYTPLPHHTPFCCVAPEDIK